VATVYFDGQYLSPQQCTVSAMDHAARYGSAAFETFFFNGNTIALWNLHYQRMQRALDYLGIDPQQLPLWRGCDSIGATALIQCGQQLLSRNSLAQGILRYTVFPGISPTGLSPLGFPQPLEMVDLRPASSSQSIDLILLKSVYVRERLPFKSTEYATTMRGLRELQTLPHSQPCEGLLLTNDGYLAEGLFSNLFAILQDGTLWTPPQDPRILLGVSAQWLIQECQQTGITITSSWQKPEFLATASAIFTTNRGRGLTPCSRLLTNTLQTIWSGDSAVHPLLQQWTRQYHSL
jgi:4-amino-4-deoxychorismate lyase